MNLAAYNKAIVSILGGLVVVLNTHFNTGFVFDEALVNTLVPFVTSYFVFRTPNRP
jgi:hypothetical protein